MASIGERRFRVSHEVDSRGEGSRPGAINAIQRPIDAGDQLVSKCYRGRENSDQLNFDLPESSARRG